MVNLAYFEWVSGNFFQTYRFGLRSSKFYNGDQKLISKISFDFSIVKAGELVGKNFSKYVLTIDIFSSKFTVKR